MEKKTDAPIWANHSIELEQAVLGSMLLYPGAPGLILDVVEEDHFFEPAHAEICRVIRQLHEGGKPVTPITVAPFLPSEINMGGITLRQYLARLASEGMPVVMARDYALQLKDFSDRRLIADIGAKLMAREPGQSVEIAEWGIQQLDDIAASHASQASTATSMEGATARAVDAAANAYRLDGTIPGMPYGIADVDRKLLGGQRGELTVLAGRPGMGKTAAALCILQNLAKQGFKCWMYSGEMGDISLTQRMLSNHLYGISGSIAFSYWQMRSGEFHETMFNHLAEAAKEVAKLPIRIEQQGGLTMAQIIMRARRWKRLHGVDVIVIDHLHKVAPSNRYAGNKVNETGEVSGACAMLAKELDCHVILLCQLSRQVEGREDKRPQLSDLRWSGDIEQDADNVLMLFRPEYYLLRSEPIQESQEWAEWQAKLHQCVNKLEWIIEKQRNGPVGTVSTFCDIKYNAIRDLHQ